MSKRLVDNFLLVSVGLLITFLTIGELVLILLPVESVLKKYSPEVDCLQTSSKCVYELLRWILYRVLLGVVSPIAVYKLIFNADSSKS